MSTHYDKICSIWCYKPKYEPLRIESWYVWMRVVPNWLTWGSKSELLRYKFLVQREPHKGERWTGMSLLLDSKLAYRLIHRPTDHKGTCQTFYPQTAMSWWVYAGQMSSSQPVWQWRVWEFKQGIFWDYCSFPTFRLWFYSGESPCMSPCEAHLSKSRQKFI